VGSNLAGPREQVNHAIEQLAELDGCRLAAVSSLYSSPPMGPHDQPDYVNAVVQLRTHLAADALLDAMQHIEALHDRKRGQRWGPRTLDLDLLVYGDSVIETERLVVPHAGIATRNFVLYPLAEIDSALMIPGLGMAGDLLQHCSAEGLVNIGSPDLRAV